MNLCDMMEIRLGKAVGRLVNLIWNPRIKRLDLSFLSLKIDRFCKLKTRGILGLAITAQCPQ